MTSSRHMDGTWDQEVEETAENILKKWWTRLQPIRTVSERPLDFAIFTRDPFAFQSFGGEASRMRRLGMSLRAIGAALGVDEKTVRKAIVWHAR